MRSKLLILALAAALPTLAGSGEKVSVSVNGKEAKNLTEGLYIKGGSYKAAPKVAYKRAELGNVTVTTPSQGLDGPQDSLAVKVTGFSGSVGYYKVSQNVAPGGAASFDLAGAAQQDFTPNGKQQTQVGRFEIEVAPLKRANVKGMYKGVITLE